MSVYNITFSPTGGTKKAADLFVNSFCPKSVCIDLTNPCTDFAPENVLSGLLTLPLLQKPTLSAVSPVCAASPSAPKSLEMSAKRSLPQAV